jgi:glycosyltransferase involved in cell wall biosynthesis
MAMRLAWICKRRYTNKDLIRERFGRLYHYPCLLAQHGFHSTVLALDYRGSAAAELEEPGARFISVPVGRVHLLRAYRALRAQVLASRPDAVLASGDTHLGWLGLRLARELQVPFIFDVYDDYRTFGTNRLPGMKRLFDRVVRQADLALCVSSTLERRLQRLNPRLSVLGNGVDRGLFKPLDKAAARHGLGLGPAAPVVGYFGSIQMDWGSLTLIEACRALRSEYPDLCLLLAGHNNSGQDFDEGFITYLGNVAQSQVPTLINACDVVAMPYHQTEQVDAINPCKLAEYLACGAPIVATRVTDLAVTLAACPQALCAPGDAGALADGVRKQLRVPCRVRFPEHMSWVWMGAVLAGVLAGVSGSR